MAIFGKNGLFAFGLYGVTLFALYGFKQVAFTDNKDVQAISSIAARKRKVDPGEYRAAAIRQKFKSDPSPEFKKAFTEKKYIR